MSPTRRDVLAAVTAALVLPRFARAADAPTYRAAVIGHTGKGDYGHGMDVVFADRPGIEVIAVADPIDAGRAKAQAKTKAARAYADFREMLEKEKPQLVSVAPRTTPMRRDMLLAALGAGAHVVSEKPFVRSPADGDAVLALADKRGLKIAVAHQMRLAPAVVHLKKRVDDGLIGDLVEMRAWGKQDKRAGGEDLTVLGIHLFDLMRMFAGDPQWCTARVLNKAGGDATAADVKSAGEDLGPVLGDEIDAQIAFGKGVWGTFTSRQRLNEYSGWWGIELIGSKGSARILNDIWPRVMHRTATKWDDAGRSEQWKPLPDDPSANAKNADRSTLLANARMVDDWLAAIREDREPVCSGRNAAKAVEIQHAIWRAALSGGRVKLPLTDRGHALGA
ncbi:MAG TPA: Gfo/Idh/MocA family oxidoreductase [Tepidisphaeraceae bacterium]|nr:Gfo/Idh/MocA family oxidoreductase [Tepidisphaeraceae bacterium]